jgi:nucleoside-diphosphate-sugar epimerase
MSERAAERGAGVLSSTPAVKTVVVGCKGTLGALLVDRLGAPGIEVRVPDPTQDRTIEELADADAVINVAGPRVRPGLEPTDYFREHVGAAARVARSMREGAHLVHVSSAAVYGARRGAVAPGAIASPTLYPSAAYACAKLAAEGEARAHAEGRGVALSILRPALVYGPSVESGLASILRLASRGARIRLLPAQVRQHLLYIDLLVEAIARAATGPKPASPRVLDVADPFVLTNADLAPRGLGVPIPLPVGARLGPLFPEALAILGIDTVYDPAPTFAALGIDPSRFSRARTFDPYWGAS